MVPGILRALNFIPRTERENGKGWNGNAREMETEEIYTKQQRKEREQQTEKEGEILILMKLTF